MTHSATRPANDRHIQALLDMALALGATSDLDTLLQMVVDYSMELLDADRATLFLYDATTKELYSRIAEGTGELRISVNTGIAGAAARDLEIINIPDAYQDDRFNREVDKQTGYRTRSILAFPLTDNDNDLVGVLQVLNKQHGVFDKGDLALAQAFAAQAGVALQRAHLVDQYIQKQRLDHAMAIAREIQQELLPRKSPPLPGFDIACWNRPCDATGGDYCDFLALPGPRLMVSFGDVTGHGVGPALVSCATRAMLRALTTVQDNVEDVIGRVNNLLENDLPTGRFVTTFLALLHPSGEIFYCSAGQGPLLWLHAATGEVDILGAAGIPAGIMADADIPQQTINLATGDVFALLTDGFYEWANSDNELFGIPRVVELLRENTDMSAETLLHTIRMAVEAFGDTKQADDLTAIIIKKTDD